MPRCWQSVEAGCGHRLHPAGTHLPIAADALRAGADVLLEKPPVLDLAEHEALSQVESATGRAVQVGFQALGFAGAAEAESAWAVRCFGVSGRGSATMTTGTRSPWAGRLPLDGALRNPFAHARMQALAVADSEPVKVEVAWCRIRDIEVDDTATLRLTLANGTRVLIAVTLAGEDFIDSRMTGGGRSSSTIASTAAFRCWRTSLAHQAERRGAGRADELTRGFTAVVEALGADADDPVWCASEDGRPASVSTRLWPLCARNFTLLNEIDTPWAATVTGGTATIG